MADEVDIANDYTQRGLEKAIEEARANNYRGPTAKECIVCGEPIPAARRRALPGVKRCVDCQEALEKR